MPDIAIQALSKKHILLTNFAQRNSYFAVDCILSQYTRPLYKKYESINIASTSTNIWHNSCVMMMVWSRTQTALTLSVF